MTSPERASTSDPDLGALFARILPRLAELEGPILQDVGLSMWEYAIVTELATGQALSQADLSKRTRRDPTRLGRHLDDLEGRSLITREAADDKRQRTVTLTRAGRAAYRTAKKRIRRIEDELLAEALTPAQSASLRRGLARLADVDRKSVV